MNLRQFVERWGSIGVNFRVCLALLLRGDEEVDRVRSVGE